MREINQQWKKTIEISKKNNVSIGAHPSFNDLENFGRKRLNLPSSEITKLVIDQINILSEVAIKTRLKYESYSRKATWCLEQYGLRKL